MLEIFLTSLTLLLNTFLGLLVFYRNTKSWTNRLFFLLTLLIGAYLVTNYVSLHPNLSYGHDQLLWIRIVMFVTSFIGPVLLVLVHTFPRTTITLKPHKLVWIGILCLVSAVAALSPFVFTSLQYPNGKPVPTPGPAIPIFFIDFVGLFILSFILLIQKYRRRQGLEKIQISYFVAGIIATFSLMALTTVIFVVILKNSDLVFLGPISSLALIGFVAYATIRHRLFDLRLALTRGVAYLVVLTFLGLFYATDLFLLEKIITGETVTFLNLITSTTLAFIIAFSFQPMKESFEKVSEKVFYKNIYDPNELLTSLSQIMTSIPILGTLVEKILAEIKEQMSISSASLILIKNHSIVWAKTTNKATTVTYDEKKLTQLIDNLVDKHGENILIYDEIQESTEKEILREHNINVLLPLLEEDKIIGAIILGEKQSGEAYATRDINVLKILANEVAISIKNALYYDEIKRFNITLEEEVKRETANLKKANERLKELDKMKDEFISIASHELRTPMTVIKSYLWMVLAGKGGAITEKQKMYLNRAYKSTDQLILFTNEILNVSRIESHRFVLNAKESAYYPYIKNVITELQPQAQQIGISLTLTTDDNNSLVAFDPEKIKEVLLNLIGNAFKFTPKGGKISIDVKTKDNAIETSISDTGSGIAKEDLPKLFQKFGMVGSNYLAKQNTQGTGLGLYIAKSIVQIHGGTIVATSNGKGKGTTFTFTLKLKK